jgi:hypothetical protein
VSWERATPEFLAWLDSGLTYEQLRAHGCYPETTASDELARTPVQTNLFGGRS